MASDEMSTERTGLWLSSNPPWGVVRAVAMDTDYAIVLDDLNGDYREVELSAFRRTDGYWDDLFNLDDQGFPDEGSTVGGSGWMMGFDGHYYAFIYGRESPCAAVTLGFGEQIFEIAADAQGWWLRVAQNDDMTLTLRRLS